MYVDNTLIDLSVIALKNTTFLENDASGVCCVANQIAPGDTFCFPDLVFLYCASAFEAVGRPISRSAEWWATVQRDWIFMVCRSSLMVTPQRHCTRRMGAASSAAAA